MIWGSLLAFGCGVLIMSCSQQCLPVWISASLNSSSFCHWMLDISDKSSLSCMEWPNDPSGWLTVRSGKTFVLQQSTCELIRKPKMLVIKQFTFLKIINYNCWHCDKKKSFLSVVGGSCWLCKRHTSNKRQPDTRPGVHPHGQRTTLHQYKGVYLYKTHFNTIQHVYIHTRKPAS